MINNALKKNETAWDKELFYLEEFKGEKIVSYVRSAVAVILAFLTYMKAGLFTDLVITKSVVFTTYILIFAIIYSSILVIIFKLNFYHPFIKYISTTFDLTLCLLSIFVYKLDSYPEYATIYFVGRYALLFIMMSLTLLRYSMGLAVYSGILVGLEYYFLVIRNNHMTNLAFTFLGPDGKSYESHFLASEGYLKVIYLVIAGVVIGILALNLKKLVISSIMKEQDKTTLLMENKIIDTINNENKKYLDNIKEGLLLINSHFLIKGHYSNFLESIFEKKDFHGTNFIDLVYPDADDNKEKRVILEKFLNILFKDTLADPEMFNEINPIKNERIIIQKTNGEKFEKIISASFYKIINNNVIEDIMVIFDDRTEVFNAEKELEVEKIKRETELEYISVILKAPEQTLHDFIEETVSLLDSFELHIDELSDKNILNEMFRGMHSLKGLARSLEFKSISAAIHEIENILSSIRDKKNTLDVFLKDELKRKVGIIFTELDNIKSLQEKFRRFSNINLGNVQKNIQESLTDFIETLKKMTETLSVELLKKVNFHSECKIENFPFLRQVKNSIIHLLRNSIDHGIEDRFERISIGKDEFGNVKLKFFKDNSNYVIEISDDGSGINYGQIKKKAFEKGFIKENEEASNSKLLNLLFKPGFSTTSAVTDISGRGVGLDVVKETVNKLGGKISIATEKNKGTKFIIKIPIE